MPNSAWSAANWHGMWSTYGATFKLKSKSIDRYLTVSLYYNHSVAIHYSSRLGILRTTLITILQWCPAGLKFHIDPDEFIEMK